MHGGEEVVLFRACSDSQCSMYGCLSVPGLSDTGVVACLPSQRVYVIHLASARLLRSFPVERTRIWVSLLHASAASECSSINPWTHTPHGLNDGYQQQQQHYISQFSILVNYFKYFVPRTIVAHNQSFTSISIELRHYARWEHHL